MSAPWRCVCLLLFAIVAWPDLPVRAQSKAACLQAYDATQVQRRDGAWIRARTAALVCAAPACPRTLVKDCTQWVQELDGAIPTVLLEVRGAAGSTDVVVFLDGATKPTSVDGKAVSLDPGQHVALFRAAGFADVSVRFVAFEGDKSRRVTAVLQPSATSHSSSQPIARIVPLSVKVSSAVGLVALGGAAVFGWQGLAIRRDLDSTGCKPACEPARVDDMKRDFLIADIAAAVGVVAGTVAGVLWLTQKQPGPATVVSAGPAGIRVSGSF